MCLQVRVCCWHVCCVQVKEQINDPAVQASIHDASMSACAQLPQGLMQEACTTFVEEYGA